MIRAIYKHGNIKPIDKVPAHWKDGQELVIDALVEDAPNETFEQWAAELDAATGDISDEEHAQFMAALEEVERESKELGRREMETNP